MTTETLAPFDPLAEAIAAADGWPESTPSPSAGRSSRPPTAPSRPRTS